MDLNDAQLAFSSIMHQISDIDVRMSFLCWINDTWIDGTALSQSICAPPAQMPALSSSFNVNTPDMELQKISTSLREMMPLSAVLPSEQIVFPTVGENSDCDPAHTLHVDSFLYDEDMVDELCDTGELARYHCLDCGSHNTQPITFVSHSTSRERLAYIFQVLLPPIPEDSILVDVGSRLGAVLYGAYFYTNCRRIVGVEFNEDFCQVQQTIINKFQLQNRIQVLSGDIQKKGDVVNAADVVILNNVFEFFVPYPLQQKIWSFFHATLKKGAFIVTVPALEESLHYIDCDFNLKDWVREVAPYDTNSATPFDFQTEVSEVKLYQTQQSN